MSGKFVSKINDIDVFSLLVFKLIFETGHANVVAKELGVSAPKISRCLSTLRLALDDDLFYRRQLGLKPTPVAEKIYPIICELTHSLAVLEKTAVTSATQMTEGVLKVAVPSVVMRMLAVRLSNEGFQKKFGLVQLHAWDEECLEMIHRGELDFGLGFEAVEFNELTYEKVGENSKICLVAKESHPIWEKFDRIKVEDICEHHFLCISSKGFNDKIDPLEQFCRENEIFIPSITRVQTRDEWYAHLLTVNSLAFSFEAEREHANTMLGIRAETFPQVEVDRLHDSLMGPRGFLVEKTQSHRRYSEEMRQIMIDIFSEIFIG